MYIIYVRNVWICREIEYLELCKLTGNWVHYMHGVSSFTEKLNIQNFVNSVGNCVHYICTECLDLHRN